MKKFERISKLIFQNIPLIFGIVILVMDIIAVSAPILAHFGFTGVAHWIYVVYSFLCHQRPWRSIHLFDYQVAWCTRDTFIYLSMALSAFFVVGFKIRKVKWYYPVLAILPFALDGTVQLIAELDGVLNNKEVFFYASTNFIRMLTGTIFGTGAGLWLFSKLDETVYEELEMNDQLPNPNVQTITNNLMAKRPKREAESEKRRAKQNVFRNLKYFLAVVSICFITYIALVRMWDITSNEYKPGGFLDSIRYFPGYNYEEVERGGHGV
jgi:uncharacterized membrane protein